MFGCSSGPRSKGRAPAVKLLLVSVLLGVALLVAGCGGSTNSGETEARVVLEESGALDPADARDPNHANLPYDAYAFEAAGMDRVRVTVDADGFTPLLKLVDAATGAPLAEWEAAYSDEDALTYTIAASGSYEARVYGLEEGTGTYRLTVSRDE